jgi:hypothetical protein
VTGPLQQVREAQDGGGAEPRRPPAAVARFPLAARFPRAAEGLVVFFGFLLAAVYATWPLARDLGSRVPSNLGDPLEVAWKLAWVAHALVEEPSNLVHGNIFHPEPFGLFYSENLVGLSVFVAPLFWATGNALITANLTVLLAHAVGAFGVYLLVRELTGSRGAAIVAGVAFELVPYRIYSIDHVHVVATHLMPFVFLVLIRLSRRPSPRLVLALGLALALQFWSSLTGGLVTLFGAGVWGLVELIRRRPRWRPVLAAGMGIGLGLLLCVPVFMPYLLLKRAHPQYGHKPEAGQLFSARVASYLTPPPGGPLVEEPHAALSARFAKPGDTAPNEKVLFPGFWLLVAFPAALLAAAVGGVRALRSRRAPPWVGHVAFFGLVALAGVVMSLGPRWEGRSQGALLPFGLLVSPLPGSPMRVPARFVVLAYFAMAVAVGVALARVPERWRRALVVASLLALAAQALPPAVRAVKAPRITAAHRAVASRTGAVLALPTAQLGDDGGLLGHTVAREPYHMYLSTAHFRPLVNGYGSFLPATYHELVRAVQDFPSAGALEVLRERGVRTLIVQTERLEDTPWRDLPARLERWPQIRLLATSGKVRVYDLSKTTGRNN